MDAELERFKLDIDLRAYAAQQGYLLDAKESWRGSSVMRHPDGDKIIIKRGSDGHYVYFSIRRDGDSGGSIIDFIQNRQRISLGAVRKELRPWLGYTTADTNPYPSLPRTHKDRIRVEAAFAQMPDAKAHPYLESERAIPAALLTRAQFEGLIRIDNRGNAIFPHFDGEGLCGYEIKNAGFTGFASGGTKGLWTSHGSPEDERLVFCESAIDALSYGVLFPDDRTRFASIGGQLNPAQPELIRAAIARMPTNAKVVAAMDADAQGAKLAEVVRQAVGLSGRSDILFTREEPFGFKDWNDQLRAKRPISFPTAPRILPSVE